MNDFDEVVYLFWNGGPPVELGEGLHPNGKSVNGRRVQELLQFLGLFKVHFKSYFRLGGEPMGEVGQDFMNVTGSHETKWSSSQVYRLDFNSMLLFLELMLDLRLKIGEILVSKKKGWSLCVPLVSWQKNGWSLCVPLVSGQINKIVFY